MHLWRRLLALKLKGLKIIWIGTAIDPAFSGRHGIALHMAPIVLTRLEERDLGGLVIRLEHAELSSLAVGLLVDVDIGDNGYHLSSDRLLRQNIVPARRWGGHVLRCTFLSLGNILDH